MIKNTVLLCSGITLIAIGVDVRGFDGLIPLLIGCFLIWLRELDDWEDNDEEEKENNITPLK